MSYKVIEAQDLTRKDTSFRLEGLVRARGRLDIRSYGYGVESGFRDHTGDPLSGLP